MKKWLALLLAAMMALALVACGDTPANNDNDNKDNDAKTEEFARGSWDGNVYTNDSLNLTVTVPDGWKIATDEELAAIMGRTFADGMDEELLVKAPHDELYALYLKAYIDKENGEYNRYADSRQLYNDAYGNFVRYWGRTYEPAQGYERGYEIR